MCGRDGLRADGTQNARLHRSGSSALQAKVQRLRDVTRLDVIRHVVAMTARGDCVSYDHSLLALERGQYGTEVWRGV